MLCSNSSCDSCFSSLRMKTYLHFAIKVIQNNLESLDEVDTSFVSFHRKLFTESSIISINFP